MLDKILNYWDKLKVRWHVVVLALLAAAPELLNWLSGIDLKPILTHFVSADAAGFIVGAMPFMLIFLKSAFHLGEPDEAE